MSLIINTKFLINETKVQKKTHSSWLTSQLSKASSLDEYIVFLNDWSQLRKSLISYIYKQIFTKKEKQHTALCLYGSGVSGNLTSKSDLDIILLYNSRFLSKDEIEKKFAIFLSIASNTTEKVDSVLFDTNRVSDASFFTKVDLFKLNAFAINTFISGNKALYNQLKTETIKNDNLVKRLLNFTYIHKQFPRFGFIESIKFHVKISPGGLLTLTLNFFFLRLSAFFSNDLDLNIEEMMKKLSKSKYFSETECLKVVGAYKLLRFVKNELELITDSDQESVEENLLFKISQKYGWVPDGKILFEAVKRSRKIILNFDQKINSMTLKKLGLKENKIKSIYENQLTLRSLIKDKKEFSYRQFLSWLVNDPELSRILFLHTREKSELLLIGFMQNPITPGDVLDEVEVLTRDMSGPKLRNRFLLKHPFLMKKTLIRMIFRDHLAFLLVIKFYGDQLYWLISAVLSRVKFFGFRKLLYMIKSAIYPFFSNKKELTNDLFLITKAKKEKILSSFVGELSKLSIVEAVYDIGREEYVVGISDLDLVIVVKKSGDFTSLKEVFYRYRASFDLSSYLFEHFPFVVTRNQFIKLTSFGIIPHLNHDGSDRLKCLYVKPKLKLPRIFLDHNHYRLSLLEQYFLSTWLQNTYLRYQPKISLRFMVKIIEKLFLNTRQFFHLKGSKKNWIKSKSNSFEILEKEVKRVVGEVIKFPTSQPDFHDVQKNSVFALHRRLGHFFKRESDHYIQKIFETGSVSSAHLFVDDKFNDIVFSRSSEKKFSIEYFLSKFLKIYKISLFNYRYKFYFDALFGNIKNFGDKELSIKIQERKTARLSWYSFLEKNNLIGWSNKPYFYDLYKKYKAESN